MPLSEREKRYARSYFKRPAVKAKLREYYNRPEVKEKRSNYLKEKYEKMKRGLELIEKIERQKEQSQHNQKEVNNEMAFKPKPKVGANVDQQQYARPAETQLSSPPMYEPQQAAYSKPVVNKQPVVEKVNRFSLEEIPTQTALVIQDQETGETYDMMSALIWIMNTLSGEEEAY